MRLMTFAALLACPFVACYCTLSLAEAAEAEKVAATCTKKSVSLCIEYLAAPSEKAEKLCGNSSGVMAKDGKDCPAEKRVGTCLAKNPEGVALRNHFYVGAKEPEKTCKLINGTWQPAAK